MTTARRKPKRAMVEAAFPFAVICTKFDGRRVLFQRYTQRQEADQIAAHLRSVGCAAVVETMSE